MISDSHAPLTAGVVQNLNLSLLQKAEISYPVEPIRIHPSDVTAKASI